MSEVTAEVVLDSPETKLSGPKMTKLIVGGGFGNVQERIRRMRVQEGKNASDILTILSAENVIAWDADMTQGRRLKVMQAAVQGILGPDEVARVTQEESRWSRPNIIKRVLEGDLTAARERMRLLLREEALVPEQLLQRLDAEGLIPWHISVTAETKIRAIRDLCKAVIGNADEHAVIKRRKTSEASKRTAPKVQSKRKETMRGKGQFVWSDLENQIFSLLVEKYKRGDSDRANHEIIKDHMNEYFNTHKFTQDICVQHWCWLNNRTKVVERQKIKRLKSAGLFGIAQALAFVESHTGTAEEEHAATTIEEAPPIEEEVVPEQLQWQADALIAKRRFLDAARLLVQAGFPHGAEQILQQGIAGGQKFICYWELAEMALRAERPDVAFGHMRSALQNPIRNVHREKYERWLRLAQATGIPEQRMQELFVELASQQPDNRSLHLFMRANFDASVFLKGTVITHLRAITAKLVAIVSPGLFADALGLAESGDYLQALTLLHHRHDLMAKWKPAQHEFYALLLLASSGDIEAQAMKHLELARQKIAEDPDHLLNILTLDAEAASALLGEGEEEVRGRHATNRRRLEERV